MKLSFQALAEVEPGLKWQSLFAKNWPAYRTWFFSEGDAARQPYLSAYRALKDAMPELMATYERLCELAGGDDQVARFLALYCPPPYLTGCSQVVWLGEEPILIRNYDYAPWLCEGTLWCTRWNGRRVIAMSDCAWGALDGLNDAGLAVSLAFGGRRAMADGFAMPLILRYVLEFAETTEEAVSMLARVPTHMAYNVTVVDRSGDFRTLYLSPDRAPVIRRSPIATNHQGHVELHRHAAFTNSLERERYLETRLSRKHDTVDALIADFHKPPLYATEYESGFGTLYTAVYYVASGRAEFRWPNAAWAQSFETFREGAHSITYPSKVPAPAEGDTHGVDS